MQHPDEDMRGELACWVFHLSGEVNARVEGPEETWTPQFADFADSVATLPRGTSKTWASAEVEVEFAALRPLVTAKGEESDVQLRVTLEGGAPMLWRLVAQFVVPVDTWRGVAEKVRPMAAASREP